MTDTDLQSLTARVQQRKALGLSAYTDEDGDALLALMEQQLEGSARGTREDATTQSSQSTGFSDEFYLAMAALDLYPVEDGLPKSTSVVFRIHQLGRKLEAAEAQVEQQQREIEELQTKCTEAFDDAVAREHAKVQTEAALLRAQETIQRVESILGWGESLNWPDETYRRIHAALTVPAPQP